MCVSQNWHIGACQYMVWKIFLNSLTDWHLKFRSKLTISLFSLGLRKYFIGFLFGSYLLCLCVFSVCLIALLKMHSKHFFMFCWYLSTFAFLTSCSSSTMFIWSKSDCSSRYQSLLIGFYFIARYTGFTTSSFGKA